MSALFDNPTNYGRIIRGANNRVEAIVEEKDATPEQKGIKEINAGIYCLDWQKVKPAFSELKTNNAQGEYYLTDIIKWGNENSLSVNGYVLKDNTEIYGINSKTNLAEATKFLNQRVINKHLTNGVTIIDPSATWISPETEIEPDTVIYPSTYIEGVNKIGKNCKIGPFAHLRGGVTLDDNVKIGNFVEVKKAHIKSNTNACHLTYIGDAEIGSHVNIGAGTITANYNPLTKEKSKTIIEDNVKIGSNSVLVAPVKVSEGANVGALSVITKDLPSWALAITRAPLRVIENWVRGKIKK
jgi:bifunctional UDP-N-acetylglucosamine pyrophosphorylase/glucosamine-1-phosphate N-acetyltransferase